jgi:hypothetical protein
MQLGLETVLGLRRRGDVGEGAKPQPTRPAASLAQTKMCAFQAKRTEPNGEFSHFRSLVDASTLTAAASRPRPVSIVVKASALARSH